MFGDDHTPFYSGTEYDDNGHTDSPSTVEQRRMHARGLLELLPAWQRVSSDHTQGTPDRFVSALIELTTREPFTFTTFPNNGNDEMITLSPIPFYTLCAHHIVPFFGNAYVSYVPDERIAGLSKFARAVKWAAKGFWVQEDLTSEIADLLENELSPRGVAVLLEAEHMCMAMRGVAQPGVITTTSAMRGVYADHERTAKAEFMETIRRYRNA